MCGRYTLRRAQLLRTAFDVQPQFEEFSEFPRYNVAPTQHVPVVRLSADGCRALAMLRWGLIPYWSKAAPKVQPINARDDTLLSSPLFRGAMERRRCLVCADGFFEWQGSKPPKTPIFFRLRSDEPFAFAGLWERWKPDLGVEPVETCLHITTAPNALVAPVHNRMPAMLRPEDYAQWLNPEVPPAEAVGLLRPYPAEEMEAYAVSTRVNSARNEGPELVERV